MATLQHLAKASKESEKRLSERMMPRDVTTRWNSTFDMLDFAYNYCEAINTITANREMKLCSYELDEDEWIVVRDLRDVLKV
jgi:hypothetical protein